MLMQYCENPFLNWKHNIGIIQTSFLVIRGRPITLKLNNILNYFINSTWYIS